MDQVPEINVLDNKVFAVYYSVVTRVLQCYVRVVHRLPVLWVIQVISVD